VTPDDPGGRDLLALPDLASRALRGSVIAASDEFFAEKENLILPSAPAFTPGTFGHKGQVYDGWETRRRRGPSGPPVHARAAADLPRRRGRQAAAARVADG
jgi:allantoicase